MSCPDCFKGTLRGDVALTGAEETIHGVPTYVARPDPGAEPIGTIVVLTDAFGWEVQNSRALADAYAKRVPAIVYVPDFMNGTAAPISVLAKLDKPEPPSSAPPTFLIRTINRINHALAYLSFLPTILKFAIRNRPGVSQPRIHSFLTAERKASPTTKIGVAGFCWGGLHAVLLTHDEPHNKVTADDGNEYPLIDCAFTAHPSLLSIPKHIHQVIQPLSVASGSEDTYLSEAKLKVVVEILEGKNKTLEEAGGEKRYEGVVYPGAKHGFAIRGDRADPEIREKGEQSEVQAVEWFKKWFV